MAIEITMSPSMQSLIGNIKSVQVEGKTVADCLEHLIEKYPQLAAEIFPSDRKLNKKLGVFLNGSNIVSSGMSRSVKEGDKLYIFDVLAGG